jgi:uncharacterized protein (TIGR00730 family)
MNENENLPINPLTVKIKEFISSLGSNPASLEADLVSQIIYTGLRMMEDQVNLGHLKLMTRAMKEMRYAYRIFSKYPHSRRISIFGSARTPEDHVDYLAAKTFSAAMAKLGWFCITGAANGIMRAGLEGPSRESTFGLSIRLPFESPTNSLIAGDPKLITFRYFFTRKLMFLSHSDAVAAFPGGFGTQDELFEVLTLMQTGKANIIPVVLIEGDQGSYWKAWEYYIEHNLLKNGWISQEDQSLYYIAPDVRSAVNHIQQFYRCYHSSRYVLDTLVIRLQKSLSKKQLYHLNHQFADLLKEGDYYMTDPLPEETDHLQFPRLAFKHNYKHFGLLRSLIDYLNQLN